ncbi:MAG: hypothetical protein ACREHG_09080 [Candidatus Saccharimonadales bacterium]
MHTTIDSVDMWAHGYFWGFVSFPLIYYIVKNLGSNIVTDVKNLWSTYVSKPAATVV